MHIMKNKSVYAVSSGLCAATASLFGKLSGSSFSEELLILRIIFFLLMILSNSLVWTLFAKALQYSDSSLTPTIASTAANYLFSAIIGYFVFGEVTSLIWWAGITLIFVGVMLSFKDAESINQKQE